MKMQLRQMTGKIILFGFVAALAFGGGCKKEERNEVQFKNIVILADTTKAHPDTASARINATFNNDAKLFSYSITFSKYLIPIKIYFNKGVTDLPIDKDSITKPYTSPVTGTMKALTQQEEDNLNAGKWSVHIKTKLDSSGNIKATLIKN